MIFPFPFRAVPSSFLHKYWENHGSSRQQRQHSTKGDRQVVVLCKVMEELFQTNITLAKKENIIAGCLKRRTICKSCEGVIYRIQYQDGTDLE